MELKKEYMKPLARKLIPIFPVVGILLILASPVILTVSMFSEYWDDVKEYYSMCFAILFKKVK